MKHICVFTLSKETKGAYAYQQTQELKQEDDNSEPTESKVDPNGLRDDQGLVGTLYLRKSKVHHQGKGTPQRLTVVVEY